MRWWRRAKGYQTPGFFPIPVALRNGGGILYLRQRLPDKRLMTQDHNCTLQVASEDDESLSGLNMWNQWLY